jgi:hypothetical protein
MSVIEKTITFFRKTLGQDVITLSLKSGQASVKALDGFVVRAAAAGLLVEVWIDDEKRNYEFGDYLELIKARELDNPEVLGHETVLGDDVPTAVKERDWSVGDTKRASGLDDDGEPYFSQ